MLQHRAPRPLAAQQSSKHPAALPHHRHQQQPTCRHLSLTTRATPHESSEFEGVEGNEDLQEALMQQLRVQIETQSLKEEIKEDLKGKAEEMKQIGEEVGGRQAAVQHAGAVMACMSVAVGVGMLMYDPYVCAGAVDQPAGC